MEFMKTLFMAVLTIVVVLGPVFAFGDGEHPMTNQVTISKDIVLQGEIARVVSVLTAHEKKQATEKDASEAVEHLIVVGSNRVDNVLLQTLLYRQDVLDDANKERAARVLIGILVPRVPEDRLIQAVVPVFVRTTDKGMKKDLRMVLDTVTLKDTRKPDFGAFVSFLRENKDAPPSPLIKYMFRLEPEAATLTLARSYLGDAAATELKNSLKGEGTNALAALSGKGVWWKDLYVAEMIRKNPHLCDPEILKRLEKDDHPIVREAIAEIKSGQGQPK
jgi:hypothetical protein